MDDLTLDQTVRDQFSYDPETGILTRIKGGKIGPQTHLRTTGYIYCKANQNKLSAHRVIWFLFYGEWPADQIDHINGDKTDNRIVNLRAVTQSQNQWNRLQRSDNSSGYKGVRRTKTGRWSAQIKQFGERTHLGTFDTPKEAYEVYCLEAATRFGSYANDGTKPLAPQPQEKPGAAVSDDQGEK